MKKKMVFWCLFFAMFILAGFVKGPEIEMAYFDYLSLKFERWMQNDTMENITPFGDRVRLVSFERGYKGVKVEYYPNYPPMEDGKKNPYNKAIAYISEIILRLRFSLYPNVRYEAMTDREYIERVWSKR